MLLLKPNLHSFVIEIMNQFFTSLWVGFNLAGYAEEPIICNCALINEHQMLLCLSFFSSAFPHCLFKFFISLFNHGREEDFDF